nr:MAG TPA: hypothetical protein [Caudoviricetes sp.]
MNSIFTSYKLICLYLHNLKGNILVNVLYVICSNI